MRETALAVYTHKPLYEVQLEGLKMEEVKSERIKEHPLDNVKEA